VREQRIDGTNVAVLIRNGPFDRANLLQLADNLLQALADAERERTVHRDVKPWNMVKDPTGSYWLLDFGLARDLSLTSLTPTAAPFGLGTYGYSPPEQMRNQKPRIDHRSDLFAAGVTIYEAGTGSNPFRAGARDDLEILRRTERMPLPPLRLTFDQHSEFMDFVSTMTQKYPDQRPRSVAEALQWLRDVVGRLP
jgi:serine/threonine-protein kinase